MPGPNIQMPGALSEMFDLRKNEDGDIEGVTLKPQWSAYLATAAQIGFSSTRSGSTSARPTSTMLRWTGMPYFDTQLAKQIFLKHASTNIWITSDGTEV